jgi:hypothetical protein
MTELVKPGAPHSTPPSNAPWLPLSTVHRGIFTGNSLDFGVIAE